LVSPFLKTLSQKSRKEDIRKVQLALLLLVEIDEFPFIEMLGNSGIQVQLFAQHPVNIAQIF
jgi:hypothetical protein